MQRFAKCVREVLRLELYVLYTHGPITGTKSNMLFTSVNLILSLEVSSSLACVHFPIMTDTT